MNSKELRKQQERFLEVFRKNEDYGEMDLTCEITNIPKFIVNYWLEDYPSFYEKTDEIKEGKKFKLFELVKKGDIEACKKFLSIYGKERGY